MKILYYTADLSYETKLGTQLTSRFSGIDLDDVIGWVKMMSEWFNDYTEYELVRADIQAIRTEDIDEV